MISRIANWVLWTALTVVVLVLAYKNTDWFKPAADKAMESVKAVVAKVPGVSSDKASAAVTIASAREAFARGDVDGAVAIYSDIVKADAKDVDARGELLPELRVVLTAAREFLARKHAHNLPLGRKVARQTINVATLAIGQFLILHRLCGDAF